MKNELSSVQVSKEFKEILRREKREEESFEDYIKRIRNQNQSIDTSIDTSIDKKQLIQSEIIKQVESVTFPDGQTLRVRGSELIKQSKELAQEMQENSEHECWDEEESETSLFDEPTKKLCQEHNLPAQYDSYYKKWMCKKCREGISEKKENKKCE